MKPGQQGPTVVLKCHGCAYYEARHFQAQGDSGYDRFCLYGDAERPIHSPYADKTPDWCPFGAAPAAPEETKPISVRCTVCGWLSNSAAALDEYEGHICAEGIPWRDEFAAAQSAASAPSVGGMEAEPAPRETERYTAHYAGPGSYQGWEIHRDGVFFERVGYGEAHTIAHLMNRAAIAAIPEAPTAQPELRAMIERLAARWKSEGGDGAPYAESFARELLQEMHTTLATRVRASQPERK